MASRQRAYSALRQDLAVVCAHVEEAATGKGEEAAKCKGYLRNLRSLKFKQALHFMVYVLNILADVSCAFQNDDMLITDMGAGCLKQKALRQLNGKVSRRRPHRLKSKRRTCATLLTRSLPSLRRDSSF
ncbi:hypothetical protein NP493_1297g00003 [Ridgeia piscesae]|uniref:Uncharacterized protein n=1 Tax=Ridgeia piscesae TaxID=27915 RepID=A0AAD9K914_RIDPI|nr:hypothetical protein NP493_1297g00003 [Ridgeia piscesae]